MTDNPYAYWEARQRGEKPAWNDSAPQQGFYRMRRGKDLPWLPVAIVDEIGGTALYIGKELSENINRDWRSCAERDVSYAAYIHCYTNGVWPGEMVNADNSAGTIELTLVEQLAERLANDKAWLAKHPVLKTAEQAHETANRKGLLTGLCTKVDKVREEEKAPHLKAGREVDDKYNPTIKQVDPIAKQLQQRINAFDAAERARIAKEQEEAARTEQTRRMLMQDTRPVPQEPGLGATAIALDSFGQPAMPPPVAPAKPATYGTGVARKVTAKPVAPGFVITNQDAVYQFNRDDPELVALLNKFAKRCVDAGIACPGVEVQEKAA